MANHSARAGYTYEKTPEEKANEALRFKNKIASTETRAQSRVAPIAALRALASKVPPDDLKRILPPGGIHDRMSPADIEAATGRIDQYHQERGVPTPGNPRQQEHMYVQGPGEVARPVAPKTFLGLGGTPAAAAQPQVGATRSTATGGQEHLVQSQSGPRWVGFVNNPPPTSAGRAAAASGRVTGRDIYEGSPDALEVAGTGKTASTPYGTIASTMPTPAAPQPRAIAGVSPGSAHDLNTGGNPPPAAPAQVASRPATAPPSAPVVAPVATTPVTPFSVGNAIRTVPPAVVGGVMQAGKDALGRVVGAVKDFAGGLAGPAAPVPPTGAEIANQNRERVGGPFPPPVTKPLPFAEGGLTQAQINNEAGKTNPDPLPSTPAPDMHPPPPMTDDQRAQRREVDKNLINQQISQGKLPPPPSTIQGNSTYVPPPAVKSAMNTVDEEEEKRRLAATSPTSRAFSY